MPLSAPIAENKQPSAWVFCCHKCVERNARDVVFIGWRAFFAHLWHNHRQHDGPLTWEDLHREARVISTKQLKELWQKRYLPPIRTLFPSQKLVPGFTNMFSEYAEKGEWHEIADLLPTFFSVTADMGSPPPKLSQQANSAIPEQPVLNHRELRSIAATGAKHVLEGASQFFIRPQYDLNRWKNSTADLEQSFHANVDWSQHMLQDVGDRVRCIAERTNQTHDAVLKHIYYYAVPIANLLQDGQRLATIAWSSQYVETVAKQLKLANEDIYAAPTPGSVDVQADLLKHSGPKQDGSFYLVFMFIAVTGLLAVLLNDTRFAVLSLAVAGFLVFLGVVLAYIWVRKRIAAGRSK